MVLGADCMAQIFCLLRYLTYLTVDSKRTFLFTALIDNRYQCVFCYFNQVELVNDNLFEWHVRLHQIDPESELAGDLRELHIQNILLHLIFPENFPFAPPFMRVIEPRIEKGFVMEGTEY